VRWHDTAFESLASRLVAASTFRLVNAVHVAAATQDPEDPLRHALKTERFSVATPFHAGRISAAFSSCHHLGNNLFRTAPMKSAFSLLVLIATIGLAHAGGFGGPPPFTNGSPLQSGTDGVYQAVASATNATGLFSFSIVGGVQTTTANVNKWVFFVDGNILSGSVVANVSNDQVTGVLDSGFSTGISTDEDGKLELPAVFVIPGNAAAGYFNGSIDLNSPIAAFSGEGSLQGTPKRDDQIVFISDSPVQQSEFVSSFVTIETVTIPGSTFAVTPFKFRGTRLTTSGR